tara:strand:+ start:4084 stop:4536 length:453 start_codon:yes stop_codon:yes gene_type:complete
LIKLQDILDKFGSAYIEKEGRWMPLTEGYCKGFDMDLEFGKMGEEFTQEVFEGNSKVEVKTERDIWVTTGNIAIEIRCNGKPSGLSTTESSVWIHLLAHNGVIKGGYLFKVDELRAFIKKRHEEGNLKLVMGGDNNASQMALIPRKELFS